MNPEIYMRERTKVSVIDHRETCHHFINYEIYDSLNEELKEKYIDQFKPFELVMCPSDSEEVKLKIICFANHHDCMSKFRVDCSESYKETLNSLRSDLKEKGFKG